MGTPDQLEGLPSLQVNEASEHADAKAVYITRLTTTPAGHPQPKAAGPRTAPALAITASHLIFIAAAQKAAKGQTIASKIK